MLEFVDKYAKAKHDKKGSNTQHRRLLVYPGLSKECLLFHCPIQYTVAIT